MSIFFTILSFVINRTTIRSMQPAIRRRYCQDFFSTIKTPTRPRPLRRRKTMITINQTNRKVSFTSWRRNHQNRGHSPRRGADREAISYFCYIIASHTKLLCSTVECILLTLISRIIEFLLMHLKQKPIPP